MTKKFLELTKFYPYPVVTDRYVISKAIIRQEDIIQIKKNWNDYRNENYLSTFTIGKEYVILFDKSINKTMMSSHEFETITNQKFLDNAKGDILIFGLGIGLIVFPLLNDVEVKSITIVEIDNGLIDEVFPIIIQNDVQSKVSVYLTSVFEFNTEKMFDTIYFDIWSDINQQSFSEMKILSEKFRKNLKPDGWMDSWCSEEENFI
jgi:spermidine synthase